MSDSINSQLILRLYVEALNGGTFATVVDDVAASSVIVHEPDGDRTGPNAIKDTMRALHEGFENLHFDVQDLIESGDRVVVRWTMHGQHFGSFAGFPATGKTVEQKAIVIYRLADERVVEVWPQIDRFGMARQLGADRRQS